MILGHCGTAEESDWQTHAPHGFIDVLSTVASGSAEELPGAMGAGEVSEREARARLRFPRARDAVS